MKTTHLMVIVTLGLSTNAFAILNETQDGNAVNTSALTPSQPSCDTTCSTLVDSTSHQILGLSGNDGWGNSDDQWCANHGAQTNPGVLPNSVPQASNAPSCNVNILQGDGTCAQVNQRIIHCQMHGSQLETQCLAYVATSQAGGGEKTVLGFDVVAASTCGLACAGQIIPAGQAMIKACQVSGMAASGAELIATLASQQSAAGKAISALGATVGLTTEIASLSKAAGGFGGKSIKAKKSNTDKKAVCTSAVIFGAMTGIRAYNIHQQNQNKTNACNQVKTLAASAFNISTSPISNGGSTGVSTTGSGMTTGSPIQTNTVRASPALLGGTCNSAASCLSSLGQATNGNSTSQAATDGGLLQSSGLAQQLAPQVADLPLDQMIRHINNGGDAGSLIQSAIGGAGGSFGSGLASLASAAQKDAANGLAGTALASTPAGGGAMNGGGPGQNGDANPFKLLNNEANLGGQTAVGFDKPALNGESLNSDGDIYHSHFSGSIFDIISDKLSKTRDRVENIDFAIPLNRKIAGQH